LKGDEMNITSLSPKIPIEFKYLEKLSLGIINLNYGKMGCWLWKDHYVKISINGVSKKVNEIIYQIYNGKLQDGETVIPSICKDMECVNPNHLRVIKNYNFKYSNYWDKSKIRNKYKHLIRFVKMTSEEEEKYLKLFGFSGEIKKTFEENSYQYFLIRSITTIPETLDVLLQLSQFKKVFPKEKIIRELESMINNL
jgi:hypothetical protein